MERFTQLTQIKTAVCDGVQQEQLELFFNMCRIKNRRGKIYRLTLDQDSVVLQSVAEAVGTVFQYVPDKEQAWKDLIKLTSDRDWKVLQSVAEAVGTVFQYVPDKEQA